MSSLIIDGYNFIGTSHRDLSAQREQLVRILSEYRKVKGHDITVVFDGWKSGGAREETLVTGGIKVIYSRLGENADSVIKRIISRESKEWIVVSSDREIISSAWANGCVPVSSAEFQFALEKSGKSFTGDYDLLPEEEEQGHGKGKGRPRTPSKKEKALLRVMKKL